MTGQQDEGADTAEDIDGTPAQPNDNAGTSAPPSAARPLKRPPRAVVRAMAQRRGAAVTVDEVVRRTGVSRRHAGRLLCEEQRPGWSRQQRQRSGERRRQDRRGAAGRAGRLDARSRPAPARGLDIGDLVAGRPELAATGGQADARRAGADRRPARGPRRRRPGSPPGRSWPRSGPGAGRLDARSWPASAWSAGGVTGGDTFPLVNVGDVYTGLDFGHCCPSCASV
jgi:hypothetical protein